MEKASSTQSPPYPCSSSSPASPSSSYDRPGRRPHLTSPDPFFFIPSSSFHLLLIHLLLTLLINLVLRQETGVETFGALASHLQLGCEISWDTN